ncbi:MAG: type II toxin-antitoxin system prevent-host-death family antitoxin [Azospirillum sp.]|nr:type II toxin-antitoxin system prevent-host-death family antitoxin [Azospirillum sp.]
MDPIENLRRMPTTALNRGAAECLDIAQREPLLLTAHERPRAVLVSVEEYIRLKSRDRQVRDAGEIGDDWLAELKKPLPDGD